MIPDPDTVSQGACDSTARGSPVARGTPSQVETSRSGIEPRTAPEAPAVRQREAAAEYCKLKLGPLRVDRLHFGGLPFDGGCRCIRRRSTRPVPYRDSERLIPEACAPRAEAGVRPDGRRQTSRSLGESDSRQIDSSEDYVLDSRFNNPPFQTRIRRRAAAPVEHHLRRASGPAAASSGCRRVADTCRITTSMGSTVTIACGQLAFVVALHKAPSPRRGLRTVCETAVARDVRHSEVWFGRRLFAVSPPQRLNYGSTANGWHWSDGRIPRPAVRRGETVQSVRWTSTFRIWASGNPFQFTAALRWVNSRVPASRPGGS